MKTVDLLQPRHVFAPPEPEGDGHIYLPVSLLTAGARLMQAGLDFKLHDANIHPPQIDTPNIGINLVGSPYIPPAIKWINQLRVDFGHNVRVVLGGQVINGLSESQFTRLFGERVTNGNDDGKLKEAFGIWSKALPAVEKTSLIPALEKISDEDMQKYLTREFCFYLSQGCKYACSFCAAKRTNKDPYTGQIKAVKEEYREMEVIDSEMRYLAERAQKLGINKFTIYLSNLDTFQTSEKLSEFAKIIKVIKRDFPGFTFEMRGLSTTQAFMDAYRNSPEVIAEMVEAGLNNIGFGVDGISPEVWKSVKKGHNSVNEAIESVRITREVFHITPEILMVMGHAADTEQSIRDGVDFLKHMSDLFGAIPRPYVAKEIVPGNNGWTDEGNNDRIEALIKHPESFGLLDYCTMPTPLTHPSAKIRAWVEKYFPESLKIPGCTTHLIYPISHELDEATNDRHRQLNVGKFDR